MEFLTSKELDLNPAGYLVSKSTNKPVKHGMYAAAQDRAHYLVELSKAVQGKSFKVGKVDCLRTIEASVRAKINAAAVINYVPTPTKPVSAVNDELVQFALDFASYETLKSDSEKINTIMNTFNVINAVETTGDYFEEALVKLNKIYSIAEIQSAVDLYYQATK